MLMKFVADKEKIKISFVPAKGGSAVLNLFASNQVDIGYTGGFHQRHPDKMKLLAAVTPKRQPANPTVPTLLELGCQVALGGQIGVVAPKDTPADIVAKLEAAVKAAVEHPDVIKIAGKFKYPLDYHDAAAATKAVREQRDFYKELIATAGSK
jgi:tripartite-type tricarboxylate transporter receptor subunit TctC